MTTDRQLLDAVAAGLRVVDLGRMLTVGMPQSPNHPAYWHAHPRRHGDMVRADGGSAANDMITMGTHVGTHVDALSHVSQDGKLYGGLDATEALQGGRYVELGAHTIEPMVRRGVLLDVPGDARASSGSRPATRSPSPTWRRRVERQGVDDRRRRRRAGAQRLGPALRLRRQATPSSAWSTGVPGVSEAGATWLAERDVHAVGADTIAFERLAPGAGHGLLPAHRVLLVERGIYIVETMDLEELARDGDPRVPLRAVAADVLRRHRLPRPPARGGRRMTEQTLSEQLGRPSPSVGAATASPTTSRPASSSGSSTSSASASPPHRLPTSAAAIGHVLDQGGHPQATAVGVPSR